MLNLDFPSKSYKPDDSRIPAGKWIENNLRTVFVNKADLKIINWLGEAHTTQIYRIVGQRSS